MAWKIEALGDSIEIGRAFVSGKDQIKINGEVVFEGKLLKNPPESIHAGEREYKIRCVVVSNWSGAALTEVKILENSKVIHSDVYDSEGNLATTLEEVKSTAGINMGIYIGGIVGSALPLAVSIAQGAMVGVFWKGILAVVGGVVGIFLGGLIGMYFSRD